MVATLKTTQLDSRNSRCQPLIVELAGPAGAGKTTTTTALAHYDSVVAVAAPPYFRRPADAPFFARHSFTLLPTWLGMRSACACWPVRREMAWMIILEGWPRVIRRRAPRDASIIILDQGPVYLLTQLRDFGSYCWRSPIAQLWVQKACERWAAVLDVVVWLDTSDATLVKRIVTRHSGHAVKGLSETDAIAFLARWRAAYQEVLARLTSSSPAVRLVSVDSGAESTDSIVSKVLSL